MIKYTRHKKTLSGFGLRLVCVEIGAIEQSMVTTFILWSLIICVKSFNHFKFYEILMVLKC